MGNCLATKLKESVDNNNLEYFDALQMTFYQNAAGEPANLNSGNTFYMGGPGVKVKVLSGGDIYNVITQESLGTEFTIPLTSPQTYKIRATTASVPVEFLLIGLSKITKLISNYAGAFRLRNPQKLVYCNKDISLSGNMFTIFAGYTEDYPVDLSYLNNVLTDVSTVQTIRRGGPAEVGMAKSKTSDWSNWTGLTRIDSSSILMNEGNISALSNLVNLTKIDLNVTGTTVTGDIASFGEMTSLVEMNINRTSIFGALEDFVSAQYSAGRKSTSSTSRVCIYASVGDCNITLGGVRQKPAGTYLAWDDGGSAPTNIRFENL